MPKVLGRMLNLCFSSVCHDTAVKRRDVWCPRSDSNQHFREET